MRRINWRAYARTNELVICDYEQERITDVNLIFDARIRAHAFVGTQHTFEFATRAIASLALNFCVQGNNVGLLVYGDILNWVFPGVGRSQVDQILDVLSQAHLAKKTRVRGPAPDPSSPLPSPFATGTRQPQS